MKTFFVLFTSLCLALTLTHCWSLVFTFCILFCKAHCIAYMHTHCNASHFIYFYILSFAWLSTKRIGECVFMHRHKCTTLWTYNEFCWLVWSPFSVFFCIRFYMILVLLELFIPYWCIHVPSKRLYIRASLINWIISHRKREREPGSRLAHLFCCFCWRKQIQMILQYDSGSIQNVRLTFQKCYSYLLIANFLFSLGLLWENYEGNFASNNKEFESSILKFHKLRNQFFIHFLPFDMYLKDFLFNVLFSWSSYVACFVRTKSSCFPCYVNISAAAIYPWKSAYTSNILRDDSFKRPWTYL